MEMCSIDQLEEVIETRKLPKRVKVFLRITVVMRTLQL